MEHIYVLSITVGFGAAAIAEAAGLEPALRWRDDTGILQVSGLSASGLAALVLRHAEAHSGDDCWTRKKGTRGRGLFSTNFSKAGTLHLGEVSEWFSDREKSMAAISGEWLALDLAEIGSLGLPSPYWDAAAVKESRNFASLPWEMTDHGSGREFVKDSLGGKLAQLVSNLGEANVAAALVRNSVKTEWTMRTGLMSPRSVDVARVWCAFWGLSLLAVSPQAHRSVVAGYLPAERDRDAWYFLPVQTEWWPLGRLRTVLRSGQLQRVGEDARAGRPPSPADSAWLVDRGVAFLCRFPLHSFQSGGNARVEYWLETAEPVFLQGYR